MRSNSCGCNYDGCECLPPNSGDLRQAEAEHQGKIYSNDYKKISFAMWPPATTPSIENLPSHPPPGNPFHFNLDMVGKSCLPTVN